MAGPPDDPQATLGVVTLTGWPAQICSGCGGRQTLLKF